MVVNPRITPLDYWIANKIGQAGRLERQALAAFQLARLDETLRVARSKSRFYRKHLAGVPQDLASLQYLTRLPFTTAQDLREHPLEFLCVSQDEIQRVVTLDTSGTSGVPKRLYFTRDDQELTIDFFRVGMSTLAAPGDRVLILLPCARPGSVGDLLTIALERLGAHPIPHGPSADYAEMLRTLAREQANCIVGTPAQVLSLVRQKGAAELRLKSVLLSTDHVPDAIVRVVERTWGCVVYNHYGMTEMGLGGGVECEARRGYHWREADLYLEIVDPVSLVPVPEGEMGEVVFTTLTRRGMPLIRYRTGDLSRIIPGDCPCGTTLKTLERIKNRLDGYVCVGKSSRLSMADLDEALFPIEGLVNYTAEITRGESKDRLIIHAELVPGSEQGAAHAINIALLSIRAMHHAQAVQELEVQVTIQPQGEPLALNPGKRKIHT
jgi:phenylacetate-CoA ligase